MASSQISDGSHDLRHCTSCRQPKREHDFAIKARGAGAGVERSKTCAACSARKAEKRTETKASIEAELDVVDLSDFLAILSEMPDVVSLEARVDCSILSAVEGLKEKADKIADLVWEMMSYRFTYHSRYPHKRGSTAESMRFVYHCAQNQQRQQDARKKKDAKPRDKLPMPAFECRGWLHVTVSDSSSAVVVKLKHDAAHAPYFDINMPPEITAYVAKNHELPLVQIWANIRKMYTSQKKKAPFLRKAIYNLWSAAESKKWKRDEDEVASAKVLLKEWTGKVGQRAEIVELKPETGLIALAFVLPDLLEKWNDRIREVSMDSTWNTNGSRFEVYAVLGEAYGSGLPLGYIMMQSNSHTPGAKERLIRQLLLSLREKWGIKARITLTDKDFSEINAMRSVFPEAKHQLCFWHVLRAVKKRFAILRRMPGYYDVKAAHEEFHWISSTFIPIAQGGTLVPLDHPIPQVRIRINDELQPVDIPQKPRLVIKLPARPTNVMNSTESTDGMEDIEAGVETEMNEGTDKQTWQDDESGDLEALLESEMDDKETDREDAPDYEFEQDEKTSKDPSYVFCPSHFRKDLLRKLTKHYCQHPLLPEQDGTRTAKEIRDAAVYEMYMFCHQRNLAEVWAYLWTQWYSPKRWHLWARSTTDLISRLRTTMNVENFWRQLKHDFLHHHLRPRLDELTYILVEHVTPAYLERAEILDDDWRYGRAHQLSTWQKYFKRSWLHLAKIECSAREYRTDVSSWTCNCGSQKYNAHLLCKHLVQAVRAPSGRFFTEIRRRRTTPIYRHPELRVHASTTTPTANSHEATLADMDMGSVTDGDDHGLKGKGLVGGKRREDTGLLTKLGIQLPERSIPTQYPAIRFGNPKQTAPCASAAGSPVPLHPSPASPTLRPAPYTYTPPTTPPRTSCSQTTPAGPTRPYPGTLTEHGPHSNHAASPQSPTDRRRAASAASGSLPVPAPSPIKETNYIYDEEYQEKVVAYKDRVQDLEDAVDMLRSQLPHPEPLFLDSFARRNIGRDISLFVQDVNHVESTGRTRDLTWAPSGDVVARRRMENTMAFRTRKTPGGREVQSSP